MTVHADMVAAHGLPAMFETLGTTGVKYIEPGSDDVTLSAILGEVVIPDETDDRGRHAGRERSATISKDSTASYGGVASVNLKDGKIEIAGERWAITEVESETESVFRLRLGRPTAITVSRESLYRGA